MLAKLLSQKQICALYDRYLSTVANLRWLKHCLDARHIAHEYVIGHLAITWLFVSVDKNSVSFQGRVIPVKKAWQTMESFRNVH